MPKARQLQIGSRRHMSCKKLVERVGRVAARKKDIWRQEGKVGIQACSIDAKKIKKEYGHEKNDKV